MLMRLDLALITEVAGRMVAGEAAGLAEEDREEAKPLVMIYMTEMYNKQPDCWKYSPLNLSLAD